MAMVGQNTEAIYRRYAIVSAGDLLRAARQLDDAAGIVRTGTDRGASDDPGFPEEMWRARQDSNLRPPA